MSKISSLKFKPKTQFLCFEILDLGVKVYEKAWYIIKTKLIILTLQVWKKILAKIASLRNLGLKM